MSIPVTLNVASGFNQATDPRSSGSYGAPSWEILPGNQATFFPSSPAVGGAVFNPPGSNTTGLSNSNLIILGVLLLGIFFFFRE
jgi:hypothetical protein